MGKIIKLSVFALAVLFTTVSCGKNYLYQKVVVNNSRQDVTVHSGCCGNAEDILVPAHSSKVVFQCTYQSYKKPGCEELDGKFTLTPSEYPVSKDISLSGNWNSFEKDKKTIQCVFVLDAE